MTDPYLRSLLGKDEKIELVARQHWFLLARVIWPEAALIVLSAVLVTLIWRGLVRDVSAALGYLFLILPLISLARDTIIWANHKYVVTNRRVIQIIGVFNKNVTDSSLEKVNDVKMVQSFWGRLFGYGDIEILTASEMGVNRFTQIGRPIRFKTAMLNAKGRLDNGQASAGGERDTASLLAQLEALRKAGVLTDEEYEKKKTALGKKKR